MSQDRPLRSITHLGSTSLGQVANVAVEITNGAGANFAQAPQWATNLRGIYVGAHNTVLSANEPLSVRGWLDSDDAVSLKPFHFLCQETGSALATPTANNATKGEFYPINCPVKPGSRIHAFMLMDLAATGGAAYGWVDFVWSNDLGKNPRYLDAMPDQQRYRVVNDKTTDRGWQVTIAAPGRAQADRTYGFSGGSYITELQGLVHLTTSTVAIPGVGQLFFESHDVPLMPAVMHLDAHGSFLGTTGGTLAPQSTSRRPVMMQCIHDNVTLDTYFLNGAGNALDTLGCWISGVEFIR